MTLIESAKAAGIFWQAYIHNFDKRKKTLLFFKSQGGKLKWWSCDSAMPALPLCMCAGLTFIEVILAIRNLKILVVISPLWPLKKIITFSVYRCLKYGRCFKFIIWQKPNKYFKNMLGSFLTLFKTNKQIKSE